MSGRLAGVFVGFSLLFFGVPARGQPALQRDLDAAAGRLQSVSRTMAGDLRPFRSVHPACRDVLDELSDLLDGATRLRRIIVEGRNAEDAREELRSLEDRIDRIEDHLQDLRVDLRPDQDLQHRRLDQRLDTLGRQAHMLEDTAGVLDDLIARWRDVAGQQDLAAQRDMAAQRARDEAALASPPAATWNYMPAYPYSIYPVLPYDYYPYYRGYTPLFPGYGSQYIELHTYTGPSGGHHRPRPVPGPVRPGNSPRPTAQQKYGARGGASIGYPNQ